jgi:hypothetical protein
MGMLKRLFAVLAISVFVSGCGQSASPTSPAATEGSLRRIVGDVSGGNVGSCIINTCTTIQGALTLDFSAGTLSTEYPRLQLETYQSVSNLFTFSIHGGLSGPPQMTAAGRMADYELRQFSLSVSPTAVSVFLVLNSPPPDLAFEMSGSAVPAFRIVDDSACSSGQRIETTALFHLEHFGRTELRDSHCVAT